MQYDLVIKNGTVVDGTGLPKQQADVAIKDGLIQQVGRINAPANETIDAEGLIVSPGFIDPHTHYDGQLTWDPLALSSSWHGVTTVVMGNCGYTLAPCRPSDKEHEYMTKTFAKVEGMSLSALEAGVPWTWETYAEYLDTLDARLGVNAVPYIGHTAVRRYVMGEECFEREANDDEIQRMRMEVSKGMAAGACGFSTSQASSHVGYYEEPIPSRLATDREIEELCGAVGDANAGNLMVLCRSAIEGINADDRKLLIRLSADNGRPVIIQGRLIQEAIDAAPACSGCCRRDPSTASSISSTPPSSTGCSPGARCCVSPWTSGCACSATPRPGPPCATTWTIPTLTAARASSCRPAVGDDLRQHGEARQEPRPGREVGGRDLKGDGQAHRRRHHRLGAGGRPRNVLPLLQGPDRRRRGEDAP